MNGAASSSWSSPSQPNCGYFYTLLSNKKIKKIFLVKNLLRSKLEKKNHEVVGRNNNKKIFLAAKENRDFLKSIKIS